VTAPPNSAHQERRQHQLVDESAPDGDAREGRAELRGLITPDGEQQGRACGGANELGGYVRGCLTGCEMAVQRERDGDGWVDVRARQVPRRVDHDHDDQPEHEADADDAERAVVVRVGDDRAAASEHEGEYRDALGGWRRTSGSDWSIDPIVSIDRYRLNRYM
jgi:hypothetical protein